MFPVALLSFFSSIALTASIISGRAKPGPSDSLLLQRENCVGYFLGSIGLAIAAGNRFLAFRHTYELANNHLLGLDYFGIDLDRPLPVIYGILGLGTACYFVWRKKTRKLEWAKDWRKLASEVAVLTVITEIITFACCVWPTPWIYVTLPPISAAALLDEEGLLPGPLKYQGKRVTQFRTNRITGERQAKMGDHWEHEFDRM